MPSANLDQKDQVKLGLAVGAGLYLADTPKFRKLLSPVVFGSLTMAVCMGLRSSSADKAEMKTVLELISGLVAEKAGSLSPRMYRILGDLVGLLLLREFLKVGVSAQRSLAAIYTQGLPTPQKVQRAILTQIMAIASSLPVLSGMIQEKLDQEIAQTEKDLSKSLSTNMVVHSTMPKKGIDRQRISEMMLVKGLEEDKRWEEGLVSGAVYHGERDHLELLNKAYAAFSVCNPLHPDIWPSSIKFEGEVVKWVADLMRGGNESVCGALTSGGTESIILAAKAHRDKYRAENNVNAPEIIACTSAHAAIDKACDLMGIKLVRVPMNADYQIDVNAVLRSISADTILIYSSAPSFPQGIIDPIATLSEIATARGIGLHVDCCLGGFVLPFAKKIPKYAASIPEFDFGLPGVTSMSVDTHKYGYASKGTSVVLYRDKRLRKYQYFAYPDWTGGLYVTPTIAGSRPGALTAAAWASLASIGEEGFIQRTQDILETTQRLIEECKKIPGIFIMGDPKAMILCFGSHEFNVLKVGDKMTKRGWSLNSLQNPNCVHLCCTIRTCNPKTEAKFVNDLKECVTGVLSEGTSKDEKGSGAALYGMAGGMPSGPVKELMFAYTDLKLKVPDAE